MRLGIFPPNIIPIFPTCHSFVFIFVFVLHILVHICIVKFPLKHELIIIALVAGLRGADFRGLCYDIIRWKFFFHSCVCGSFSFFFITTALIRLISFYLLGPSQLFWAISSFRVSGHEILPMPPLLFRNFLCTIKWHDHCLWSFLFAFISPINLLLSMRSKSRVAIPFPQLLNYATDSKTRHFLLDGFHVAEIES